MTSAALVLALKGILQINIIHKNHNKIIIKLKEEPVMMQARRGVISK